jgi:multidrug efflux pump subunit AcrA (membrane-fusion protein)
MLAKTALVAAAVLVAAPAFAQPYPPTPPAPPAPAMAPLPPAPPEAPSAWGHHRFVDITLDANDGWNEKKRAKFDAKMKELDEKLARLDVRLKAEESEREVRMKAIIARAEEHARYAAAAAAKAQLSPERIRAITEHAMAEAQAGERAAEAAERAIEAIQPQLDALSQRLDHLDFNNESPTK